MYWLLGVGGVIAIPISVWLYGIRLYEKILKYKYPHFCHNKKLLFNTGKRGSITLTIDDVPWEFELTTRHSTTFSTIIDICNILKQNNCSASLMMIGSYIENASDEVIDKLRHFHDDNVIEYANHGFKNTKHASLSETELEQEIDKTEQIIRSKLQSSYGDNDTKTQEIQSKFYRPGHGMITESILRIADGRNYTTLLGDVYSFDPHIPIFFLNLIHIMITVRSGSIIILHDRPWTPFLLRYLLPVLKWRGYNVEMASETLRNK